MTVWQDGPPLTRREARERERAAALETGAQVPRRAATTTPTTAGDEPEVSTPFIHEPPTAASTDQQAAAPSDQEFSLPVRPHLPRYETSFDDLLTREAAAGHEGQSADQADVEVDEKTQPGILDHRSRSESTDYFKPTPPSDSPQPVTVPVAVVEESDTRPPQPETVVPERTLTRRELRAMLQAQEANLQSRSAESGADDEVDGVDDSAAGVDEVAPLPAASQRAAPLSTPVSSQRPVGHWSTAGDANEQGLPFDQVIAQHVDSAGSGSATSSLILPMIPSAPDATGPLTSTGEILVTGSIDLPRSLGATGQHPDRYDSAAMDRMFDSETDVNTSTVAPIRASRAVSTHTSTRGVIAPRKKRGGRSLIILAVTAGILAIGVIALVVAGFVFKVF
ncbi:hypothetical protein [Leifsonia sp. Root112D2]|jgi:hypothetical protein|uniref:hypothetical protein n=1 Tax=Leifsonia sp. Root112D2 TaxID=1736426 RepID=UPI0007155F18|nr:hypothetical protein [Leifsonia sp. Root112D2]KQV07841.1 hypothetical protein ASC63_11680 [Leifsonia sp. Root112D2]